MSKNDFEGTLVLERLAEIGKLEAFYEAVDSDDLQKARQLMKKAKIDNATIEIVLNKIIEGDD